MREWLMRLRAALTPQALALLAVALLLLGGALGMRGGTGTQRHTELEARIGRTLSGMSGAGEVDVVIMTRMVETKGSGFSSGIEESVCGAVAVAQGADDPIVHLQLQEALCALLGLPASAVSVVAGGEMR